MPSQTFFNLPAEKRENIISAAYDEFCAHTFEETNMRDVLEKMGIGTGSFYRYFESKDELYLYILDLKFREANDTSRCGANGENPLLKSSLWQRFRASSSDIQKKYYFRMTGHYLYEMQRDRVDHLMPAGSERHRTSLAFLLAVLPYVANELTRLCGEDYNDEWCFFRDLLLDGLKAYVEAQA